MTEPAAPAQHAPTSDAERAPDVPVLYLSSEAVGWDGLLAQAFYEPRALEGYIATALPDLALVLFRGGPMRLEQRSPRGPWRATQMLPGDLMLRPGGGPPYEVRWQSLTPESTQTLHLHVAQQVLARTAEEVGGNSANLSLVGRAGFQDPLLMQIGFALWRELEQPASAGKLYAQTAAQMLAVHLLRHYTAAPVEIKEPTRGLTPQQMRRVVDFIQAHLGQDLSLEALAQQTGFSPYHFTRLFRQATGESPHRFVLGRRIERAEHLLKVTDLPLAQIALESGFANQSHLTRVFREQRGLTPRAFRQAREGRARF